ncbi:unnamed protein product, partial [Rotaria socialis]
AEHYQGVVPYLRRSRSKVRTPSPPPIRTTSSKRSVSPSQTENYQESIPYLRSSKSKIRAPTPIVEHTNSARSPTVNEDKIDDIDPQQTFTYYSLQNINESMNTSSPVMVENEEHTTQNYNVQNKKDTQRTTAASSAVKSAKSIVLINPDDQSIAVVENSYTKGAKSVKIARFIERDVCIE